ncbi:magnesium-translocating P-type ATPase [Solimonas variicoloris]|uniref:magnesium-translocating P-type ATPase n=1 Tax=Solimonas variicoloris TaxID=254408 RepID=UPI0003A86608|nr:magnesium-translocating P-type ATPase [Solimonas variicoloris]
MSSWLRWRALAPSTERPPPAEARLGPYWSFDSATLQARVGSGPHGLSADEAQRRLRERPPLHVAQVRSFPATFAAQFRSPLQLILVLGAAAALLGADWINAAIVMAIALLSSLLGAIDEHKASHAVARLQRRVAVRAAVLRDGAVIEIPADAVVPGDVVLLSAGSLVPGDGVLLECQDLFVGEAALTGETFAAEKSLAPVPAASALPARRNCVFAGTSVRSGVGRALIVATGAETEFGRIAHTLQLRAPETDFERGLRHFGQLLIRVMILLMLAVLAINALHHRPSFDSLLFAIALAVGLSPELLPAIVAITLAHGARRMATRGVIVRHPNAIENLGAMDVLCVDKTGTLTRGVVMIDAAVDAEGHDDERVLQLARLNAALQAGLRNPIDEALLAGAPPPGDVLKLDEIPYDFVRKRLSVVIRERPGEAPLLITKGAVPGVLAACTQLALGAATVALDAARREALQQRFEAWGAQGFRVLAVAQRTLAEQPRYGREDESALVLRGFLLLFDPPEPGIDATLRRLAGLGVSAKLITGDSLAVARHVAQAVGLDPERVIGGAELGQTRDEALWQLAPRTSVFAEVDPGQKERIIRALQRSGHVVGFLGDGINDAPALYAADVGISVDTAADVAREAADFVMLEHGLDVVCEGIEEGRRTFANTLKYIFVTTSANFGNMLSMAVATTFLPFLPLLAKQILLNNFLSDIPTMGLAGDRVDDSWQRTPHRWDLRQVKRVMVRLGVLSTLFDLLTFAVLLGIAHGDPEQFRTAWFIESLLTELLIIFVLRTRAPFYRSRPAPALLWGSVAIAALGIGLPYVPLIARGFGFEPLPPALLATMVVISLSFALVSERLKRVLYEPPATPPPSHDLDQWPTPTPVKS